MVRRIGLGGAALVALTWILGTAGDAGAGGVGLLESGGRRMGSAYAGGAAEATDATTIWWNPAGMTRLRRYSFAAAAHYIAPSFRYTDAGSLDAGGQPLGGVNADGGQDELVPSAFAAARLNRCWSVGLSVNAPFGLSTKYPDNWFGRYFATDSELTTVNINPAVAYRVNQKLSIGAGFDAMYADAKLQNQVDFGGLGGNPQAADGTAKVEGNDWGFGWNLGLLYEHDCCTRFGIHYRSRVKHTLDGDGTFVVPPPVAPALPPGTFVNTGAHADIEFPDSLSISGWHRINSRLAVMGDATWTGWSSFDALVVKFDNPLQPDSVLPLDWNDTWRFSLGVSYTPNRCWEFRAGVLYDEGPAPTATRTPRVPDTDRLWVTAGVGYRVNARLRIDLSYAHIFGSDAKSRLSNPRRGTLTGDYDSDADLIGFQISVDF